MTVWRERFQKELEEIKKQATLDAAQEMGILCQEEDSSPAAEESIVPSVEGKSGVSSFRRDQQIKLLSWSVTFEDQLNRELSHRILFWGSKIDSNREGQFRRGLQEFKEALVDENFEKAEKIKNRLDALFQLYQGFTSHRDEVDQYYAKWTAGLLVFALACFALPTVLGGGAAATGTGGGVSGETLLTLGETAANDNAYALITRISTRF